MASPDWAKFGLNNEKQPLNPGAGSSGLEPGGGQGATNNGSKYDHQRPPDASTAGSGGGGGGVTLFGGQVQSDNELFADDQVRKMAMFLVLHVLCACAWICGAMENKRIATIH